MVTNKVQSLKEEGNKMGRNKWNRDQKTKRERSILKNLSINEISDQKYLIRKLEKINWN